MLKLKPKDYRPAIVTVKFGGGAEVDVRPLTSVEYEIAFARAKAEVRKLRDAADASGLISEIIGTEFLPAFLQDESALEGVARQLAMVEGARIGIKAWRGIGDDAGVAVEPGPDTIAALMRERAYAPLIEAALERDTNTRLVEGNASTVLPSGAGETVEPGAAIAASSEKPAPPAA
jgi:hypothetical protein